jgi:hypothetical protein
MKIIFIFLLPLLILTGCPYLESDLPPPSLEIIMEKDFRIHGLDWAGSLDRKETHEVEVRVLDIDPGPGGRTRIFLRDPDTGSIIPGRFKVSSNTISVSQSDMEFIIEGQPNGMGIVTFENIPGNKIANLYVFVRNWRREDVYRHILDPDPVNYRFFDGNLQHPTVTTTHTIPFIAPESEWNDGPWAIYKLIVDRGFHYESPSGNSNRAAVVHGDRSNPNWFRGLHHVPHILYYPQGTYPFFDNQETWKEPFLRKPVFAFTLHLDYDGDMVGGFPDRQRLELKTMDNTRPPLRVRHRTDGNPGIMGDGRGAVPGDPVVGFTQAGNVSNYDSQDRMFSIGGGETVTHRWKFKLPENFIVSTEYTHIHQLKPEGADNSQPTITLTARRLSNGEDVLQLSYRGPIRDMIGDREIPSVNWFPVVVPLEPFRGEWIYATETVTYDNPGSYRIKLVRIRDLRVMMEFEFNPQTFSELNFEDPFVMFRKGNTYIRKKTGFYRRIMHVGPFGVPDRDRMILAYMHEGNAASILYTDLEMDKWRD